MAPIVDGCVTISGLTLDFTSDSPTLVIHFTDKLFHFGKPGAHYVRIESETFLTCRSLDLLNSGAQKRQERNL
jgi:hypothetical protein